MPKMKAHALEARMAGQDLTPMCSEPMGLSQAWSGSWWGGSVKLHRSWMQYPHCEEAEAEAGQECLPSPSSREFWK